MRILTNRVGSAASDKAAPEPLPNTDSTDQVGDAGGETSPEHGVSREPVHRLDLEVLVNHRLGELLDLARQDDGDDESIDGDCLAEDDGDEVLGLDPGGLDASADDGGAGGVDAESGAHHGQGHG